MDSNSHTCSCPPTWKRVVAFLVDFLGSFLLFGVVIAYFSGNLTSNGFQLEGIPALFLFGLMITYFIIMKKFFGGTFGKKIFGISSRKKSKC